MSSEDSLDKEAKELSVEIQNNYYKGMMDLENQLYDDYLKEAKRNLDLAKKYKDTPAGFTYLASYYTYRQMMKTIKTRLF